MDIEIINLSIKVNEKAKIIFSVLYKNKMEKNIILSFYISPFLTNSLFL